MTSLTWECHYMYYLNRVLGDIIYHIPAIVLAINKYHILQSYCHWCIAQYTDLPSEAVAEQSAGSVEAH